MSEGKFIVERERMEDGSVYPRHIVGGARDLEVCQLESQVVADLAANDPGGFYEHDAMAESADDVRSKRANANLIATAPELLEALKSVPDPSDFANPDSYRWAVNSWWDKIAEPAIRKAEGKE